MYRPKPGDIFINVLNGEKYIAVNPNRHGRKTFAHTIKTIEAKGEPFFYFPIDKKGINKKYIYWGDDFEVLEGKFVPDTKAGKLLFTK